MSPLIHRYPSNRFKSKPLELNARKIGVKDRVQVLHCNIILYFCQFMAPNLRSDGSLI